VSYIYEVLKGSRGLGSRFDVVAVRRKLDYAGGSFQTLYQFSARIQRIHTVRAPLWSTLNVTELHAKYAFVPCPDCGIFRHNASYNSPMCAFIIQKSQYLPNELIVCVCVDEFQ
jgi:hypothetical protein